MPDVHAVRAFLDPHHLGWAQSAPDPVVAELRALPEAGTDDAARQQAREILEILHRFDLLEAIVSRDVRMIALIRETLAWASPLSDAVFALQALSATPMILSGNPLARRRWVSGLVGGQFIGGFAMTEPEAGTDVGSLQTSAVRDGDHYVLNGQKTLISNAGIADVYTVFATTDPERGSRGITAFAVPADTPGLEFAGAQIMSAPHPLGNLRFEDCRVPAELRLGEEGTGFKIGMATLDSLRPTVAAAACGMAASALDEALSHAVSREQFGKPLSDFQLTRFKLARMAMDLDAARLLTYRASWEQDQGADRITTEAAMAKAFATEAAQRIVDDAVQILGGRGVLADSRVDLLYRSVRALRIYEGTTEIQHLIIAGQLLRSRREE